jgi:prevent-host-death family protein
MRHENTITTAGAREKLAELINRTAYAKERLVLTRRGKEVAAPLPFEDVEVLEQLEDLIDLRDARRAVGGEGAGQRRNNPRLGPCNMVDALIASARQGTSSTVRA